ncbi:response regulator transcription factor [Ravibacter arvi]|uniref:Response regulator transcription factor n=1 Tax=Ravibacter arvi TaxID=2051041 RepID=A0ABP8LLZ9_9BACT
MIRVAIFEDNIHLRDTLRVLLDTAEGFSCTGSYPGCEDMLVSLREIPCDVVLMDIEMTGMNGIEATRLIRQHFPAVQVLIQTAFFDDNYIFNAICAGASGYVLKTTSPAGYLEAISDVKNGGSSMSPGVARRMLELFRDKMIPALPADYQLTAREKDILKMLVKGKSYKMIAADLYISLDTVKTHIRNVYAKLHVNSGTEAVAKAIRDGLV